MGVKAEIRVQGLSPDGNPTRQHLVFMHGLVAPLGPEIIEASVTAGKAPRAVLQDPTGMAYHRWVHEEGEQVGTPVGTPPHVHSRDRQKIS